MRAHALTPANVWSFVLGDAGFAQATLKIGPIFGDGDEHT